MAKLIIMRSIKKYKNNNYKSHRQARNATRCHLSKKKKKKKKEKRKKKATSRHEM